MLRKLKKTLPLVRKTPRMRPLFGGVCSGFFSAGLNCDVTGNLKHLLVTITYIIYYE